MAGTKNADSVQPRKSSKQAKKVLKSYGFTAALRNGLVLVGKVGLMITRRGRLASRRGWPDLDVIDSGGDSPLSELRNVVRKPGR